MIRRIVLGLFAVLAGGCLMASAQSRQVKGTVTDDAGDPLIGATVQVKGTTTAIGTDASGRYTITAPSDGTLVFSYVGMNEVATPVGTRTQIDVRMTASAERVGDVLVIAFGEQKKEAFTGSASVMSADMIAKTQNSNIASALAGATPGVQVQSSSGQPGSQPRVLVRGLGSISSSVEPLWVVDGIPYDGDLSLINPADVESMTTLKDAASTALYGSRGSNGVIMVTTKRGKGGDPVVTVDLKVGVNTRAVRGYEYIDDPALYYETIYGAIYDYGRLTYNYDGARAQRYANQELINNLKYQVYTVPEGQYFIGSNGKVNPRATLGSVYTAADGNKYYLTPDDWEDEAFRSAIRQEYNANISASNDRGGFYASFGYLNDQGIVEHSFMERYTGRLRADYRVKKWLRVGGNFAYSHYKNQGVVEGASTGATSVGNIFGAVQQVGPIYPVYVRDENGNILYDKNGLKRYDYGSGKANDGISGLSRPVMGGSNALANNMLDIESKGEGNTMMVNGFVNVDLVDGLRITLNAGTNLDETRFTSFTNPYYGGYAESNGIISKQHNRFFSYNLQQLINYTKSFGEHNLDLMVGHENYRRATSVLSGSRSNMFSDKILELASGIINGSTTSYENGYNTEGYLFRGQYDYDSRLFFSGSYRRDASSRFAKENRWGNFWSVGGAWILSREQWFHSTWVDMLKVKLSYGSQGNDGIGDWRYTDLYTFQSAGGEVAAMFYAKGNPNITWETNANLNAGIEFELWQSRLTGSVEYFYRKTTDMLFRRPVAPSLGYTNYYDNIGDMHNAGVEINLSGDVIRTRNVQWTLSGNLTHYKNRIDKLPPEKEGSYSDGSYHFTEGKPLYSWYLKKYAGVSETGEALYYIDNQDGTHSTTTANASASYYKLDKTALPDFYGGFGTTLRLYGFDVSVNFTYSVGGYGLDYGYMKTMKAPGKVGGGQNIHRDVLKSWTAENPSKSTPRFFYEDLYTASASDRFLLKANYLNLQNINVGYTFPTRWMKKIGIQSLRLYVSCENVAYWSKRKGFDPRQMLSVDAGSLASMGGMTNDTMYSPIRTISGGMTIQF